MWIEVSWSKTHHMLGDKKCKKKSSDKNNEWTTYCAFQRKALLKTKELLSSETTVISLTHLGIKNMSIIHVSVQKYGQKSA